MILAKLLAMETQSHSILNGFIKTVFFRVLILNI